MSGLKADSKSDTENNTTKFAHKGSCYLCCNEEDVESRRSYHLYNSRFPLQH